MVQDRIKNWGGEDLARLAREHGIHVVYMEDSCFATDPKELVGMSVIMPDPHKDFTGLRDDAWEHSFSGRVRAVRQGDIVQVMDADDNAFDVEWYRLELDTH